MRLIAEAKKAYDQTRYMLFGTWEEDALEWKSIREEINSQERRCRDGLADPDLTPEHRAVLEDVLVDLAAQRRESDSMSHLRRYLPH